MWVFTRMNTQWHMGMGGPVGLVYQSLPVILQALRVPEGDWLEVIDAVRVMERRTLELAAKRDGG